MLSLQSKKVQRCCACSGDIVVVVQYHDIAGHSPSCAVAKCSRRNDGRRSFSLWPVHPFFFSIYSRFHRRCAARGKQRWLPGEMPAVYWGNVAEWEHDDGETALYSWRMGTRVILPLHHFRGHRVSHPVRCTGVADLFLPLQRPRRVGNPSLHIKHPISEWCYHTCLFYVFTFLAALFSMPSWICSCACWWYLWCLWLVPSPVLASVHGVMLSLKMGPCPAGKLF